MKRKAESVTGPRMRVRRGLKEDVVYRDTR